VKDTCHMQPERFIMDINRTRQMMATIERGHLLTTIQARLLFMKGVNQDVRMEIARLILLPDNRRAHWTVVPENETQVDAEEKLRELGKLAQQLYMKLSNEGMIAASSVVSLFVAQEAGEPQEVPEVAQDHARPAYEPERDEEELPGPPPQPMEAETLNAIGDRRKPPYKPYKQPTANTTTTPRRSFTPRKFQAQPGSWQPGQKPAGGAQTASLFGVGAEGAERPPNLAGPTEGMVDQHGKPYKCYNCGRLHHIASGCKYQPVGGPEGDKSRELRRITSLREAARWIPEIMDQGVSDHFTDAGEQYCLFLNETVTLFDSCCSTMG
jgi:hypothetical protein